MKKIIIAILSNFLLVNYCLALDIFSEQDLLTRKPDKCPDLTSLQIKNNDSVKVTTLERSDSFVVGKTSVLGAFKIGNYGTNVPWQLVAFNKNEIFNYNVYINGFSSDDNAKIWLFMTDNLNSLQPAVYSTYYNTLRLEKLSQLSENYRWVCHYLTKDPTNTEVDVYYPNYY